jgi:hypothetical protein
MASQNFLQPAEHADNPQGPQPSVSDADLVGFIRLFDTLLFGGPFALALHGCVRQQSLMPS